MQREYNIWLEPIEEVKETLKAGILPFEVYPEDLPETMTWVKANEYVNAMGGGWRIPTLEELKLMYLHKESLGGFRTATYSGSEFPDWYWSSTECRDYPTGVHGVRFSDGYEDWSLKDYGRLSCRPVRLVEASSARFL